MKKDKAQPRPLDETRGISRLGLLAASILYPSWSLILKILGIDAIDPAQDRIMVVSFGILFLIADLLIDHVPLKRLTWVRFNWPRILSAANTSLFALIAIHYFYLTRINHMHPVYSVGAFIVIFASCAVLNDARSLAIYSVETFVLSIWASVSDTTYFRYYFVAAIGTALLVSTLGTLSRLKIIAAEKNARRLFAEQQEKLIATSRLAAVGEMSGGMAHEINTPLATITMNISMAREILEGKKYPEELAMHLDSIERTTKRIAAIVKGLLTFSRGEKDEKVTRYNVRKLIEETLLICIPRLNNEHIALQVECPPELQVQCGKTTFGQALLNLLNNAFDATETRAERKIRIHAYQESNRLLLAVIDNGTGIPTHVAHKIFQPFFTTKEIGKGTGLGLSITRGLVEGNEGSLTFTTSSEGTCFIISLPAARKLDSTSETQVA